MADKKTDPEIIPPFKGDAEGFLVGKMLDKNELKAEFERISRRLTGIARSVAEIEKALTKAGLRSLSAETMGSVAVPAASATKNDDKKAKPTQETSKSGEISRKTWPDGEKITEKAVSDGVKHALKAEKSPIIVRSGGNIVDPSKKEARHTDAVLQSVRRATTSQIVVPDRRSRTEAVKPTAERDKKGRFVSKNGGSDDAAMKGYESDHVATNLANKIADAVHDGAEDMRQTDPVVAAVSEVAEPISHAYSATKDLLAGSDNEETGLLKRILSTLKRFRGEQSIFNKAEKKTLTGIENNTEDLDKIKAGDGGGRFPLIGGLGKKVGGALGTVGAGALKFAKKIPLIGSIFAAGKGLFDFANSELDTRTTREEKDRRSGAAIGDAAGIIGGGFAGAKMGALAGAFLGPVGSAIGTAVGGAAGMFFGSSAGKIVGETVGGWVSDLRKADIAGQFIGAWDTCATYVKEAWSSATETVTAAWSGVTESVANAWNGAVSAITGAWTSVLDGVSGFWDKAKSGAEAQLNGINDWIKEKTGFDVRGSASAVTEAVTGAVKGVGGMIREVFRKSETPSWGLKNSGALFDLGVKREQKKLDPKTWVLGDTSAKFESGSAGAGTVSTGNGDRGGKSYGTYQLSSRAGTLQQFLKESPYGKQLEAFTPGSPAFDAAWQDLARNDPDFAKAQHDFIKRTHYDKANEGLKEAGIDLSGRGKAVQDAVWSTSVQFGAGKADGQTGAVPLFQKALQGRDINTLSDEQIISAVQDYKLANNDRLFGGSGAGIRAGTAKRAVLEKQRLIALARLENPSQAAAERPQTKGPTIAARAAMETAKVKGVSEQQAIDAAYFSKRWGLADKAVTGEAKPGALPLPINAASPVVAAATIPNIPPMAGNIPAPAKSIPVPAPMNSSGKNTVTAVRVESDAGQDVKERGIAHIVTGGLS